MAEKEPIQIGELIQPTEAEAVRDLCFAGARASDAVDAAVTLPPGYTVHDLERYLDEPRRKTGGVRFDEPGGFASYLKRHATAETTVWADLENRQILAIINDHADVAAGWRDWWASYILTVHRKWQRWRQADGNLYEQRQFAHFLEDNLDTIGEPDGAELLEICRAFEVTRTLNFGQAVDLRSGAVRFEYSESDKSKAGNEVAIPEKITLALPLFEGRENVLVDARLRWDIPRDESGRAKFGFVLIDWEDREREEFDRIRAELAGEIEKEIWAGSPFSEPIPV